MAAWFLTLAAAITIIGLVVSAHLDGKYREQARQWQKDKRALEAAVDHWQGEARRAKIRIRTMSAERREKN